MIKGANSVKQIIRNKIEGIQTQVSSQVKKIGEGMEFVAQLNAPDMISGTIKGEYANSPVEASFTVKVMGPADQPEWAVWFEFGSGVYAANYVPGLPKEWRETARKFYINGEGRTIEQPYLYPAYTALAPKVIEEAQKILKGR